MNGITPARAIQLTLIILVVVFREPRTRPFGPIILGVLALFGFSVLIAHRITIALATRGRLRQALALANVLVWVFPNSGTAHNNKGWILSRMDRHEEALAAMDKAIILQGEGTAHEFTNRGNTLASMERFDEAIDAYKMALELDGRLAYAMYGLGVVYLRLEEYGKAIEAIEGYIRLKPRDVEGYMILFQASLFSERYMEALQAMDGAMDVEPGNPILHANKARTHFMLGDLEGCVSGMREAVGLDPDDPATRYELGRALLMKGQRDEGLGHMRVCLTLDGDYAGEAVSDELLRGCLGDKGFTDLILNK